jgi:hypothetical protein
MSDTLGGRVEYPAALTIDPPDRVANWRPLVQWLLAIPHLIIARALDAVSQAVAIISWFAILFTGKLPAGLANLQAMFLRYSARAWTYATFMREEYPPFSYDTTTADPGDDPRVRVDVVPALEDRNRLTTGFRLILAIPQLIVIALLSIGMLIALLVAFFAVLFTGRWPESLYRFVVGVLRWSLRVQAYVLLLTDEYPPFATDELGGTAPQPVPTPA